MSIKTRVKALEGAMSRRKAWPAAWPSIEAAAAAGVRGGFLLVGEVLPLEEWTRQATEHMRYLLKGETDAIH